ncbi:3-isopropylmalate dehydratase large subunit [Sphaerisporangium sp. TRM90804]|uniref:3-isopropylmalate dehydratase large subunit n=1 Tax=Sphaerisporangium sp. TRM90804 TaxID=3031113 RepID=UPI00244AA575|nr:3-isopropylmalate dehydratase large subunit [Sphaerisporangium sp. TRM90804]MDH2427998.1 3-isopropylmalate dehydratase large subunit [Sphaerisporangium sp. TRM90804]
MAKETLAQKVWQAHTIKRGSAGNDLLYVDLQLLHEVNTPQAFEGLRAAGRRVRRPDLTVGTEDHTTPTVAVDKFDPDPARRLQRKLMRDNCAEFGIPLHRLGQASQGIYAVIGPELGLVQPGMTIVCCDSHTTTLGAFGALAFGIGTSQVEHVLATQTVHLSRPGDMAVTVDGRLPAGVTAKDLALALIAAAGTSAGQGHIVEYRGEAVAGLTMEGRLTLCNMAVEMGARAGMVAADEVTIEHLGPAAEADRAYWRTLRSDEGAVFDKEVVFDARRLTPYVSWGTNPSQSVPLDGRVPSPAGYDDDVQRAAAERALQYMDLRPGTPMRDIGVDVVFLGSCTNSRIEDLRAAAGVLSGRRVADHVQMIIVPGSTRVRRQAVEEGLDRVFTEAGADFRVAPGCSMCVALGEDRLRPGQRAASTTNRNFEGRQGKGARTHLVSPAVAAATAVAGRLSAPGDL